jgi:crotonobetainyl-CoA:carnitine CoA-transferase CaiB-like acyl-CoA transferase
VAKVLQGIRVLDLSRVFAGPAATQILGDLGADVIKVEEPSRGDEARYFGVSTDAPKSAKGVSPSFVALNRNKRSIAIDLASAAGREVVRRMARDSDVVVHNFRPGAMRRWGLGYADLHALNPRLIYCEFYAYGKEGPLAHVGANDLALQAHSGLMSITGEPGRPPVRCGSSIVDLHASVALVAVILAALLHRERTGEGQVVETSLLRSSAHLMNYFYGEYWSQGVVRGPMGTANHLSVPNQVFPASDGSVVIIAPSDEMWERCALALDAEQLHRPEYKTMLQRQQQRGRLADAIGAITRTKTSAELVELLAAARVNVAKLNSIGEAADHRQLSSIDAVVEFDMDGERVKAVASPFALEGTPATVDRPPPALGAHTDEILAELGVAKGDIAAWRTQGAFGPKASMARAS